MRVCRLLVDQLLRAYVNNLSPKRQREAKSGLQLADDDDPDARVGGYYLNTHQREL